jgi:hypothetical protein
LIRKKKTGNYICKRNYEYVIFSYPFFIFSSKGASRGFAFVEFGTKEEAIQWYDQKQVFDNESL